MWPKTEVCMLLCQLRGHADSKIKVQYWISVLLAIYGVGLVVFSRKFCSLI